MTSIVNFMKRHPALTYGLVGLVAAGVVWVADVQYDSGGIAGVLFWGTQIFLLPFWLVSETLSGLTDGAFPGQGIISVVGGLGICLVIDLVLSRLRLKK